MRELPSNVGGRYEVLRLIDEGGHALVYLARDARLGRLVALKTLKPEHRGDAALAARLEQEVRLLAQLNHPNLVTLHDWISDQSGQYAVLEYAPGENLKSYARRRGRLEPDEALAVIRQVLAALETIHATGVVHRDVKPQNVLLVGGDVETGEERRERPNAARSPLVKLTDLGIARVAVDPGLTPIGAAVGTPQYLSPEQAMGKPGTPASDVYACGAVLYELLVGRPPFDGDSELAIVHQQAYVKPQPPREIVPGLSPDLERVVLCALAKDPAERYQSAEAFSAALDGLSRGVDGRTATLTTIPTVAERPRAAPSKGRRRLLPLLPLLAVGLVLAFVLSGLYGWLTSGLLASTPTARQTATATPTTAVLAVVATPTFRPTQTQTPTPTPVTPTPTYTPRPTLTPTPTVTPTPTRTRTPTPTRTPRPTATPTRTVLQVTVEPMSSYVQSIGTLRGDGGRVSVQVNVQGGRDDIVVALLRGNAVVRDASTVQGQGSIDVPSARAGTYRVLLDNRLSFLTSKQVTLSSRIIEPR